MVMRVLELRVSGAAMKWEPRESVMAAGLGPLRGFRDRGVAVVSLAKRIEEIFLPGRSAPPGRGGRRPNTGRFA